MLTVFMLHLTEHIQRHAHGVRALLGDEGESGRVAAHREQVSRLGGARQVARHALGPYGSSSTSQPSSSFVIFGSD